MERRKRKLKDNVGSYNESCECGSASTKGYVAHFDVQNFTKNLKENLEKKKTAVFSQAGQRENRRFFRSLSR